MKTSVALCTYNGEKYLAAQLDSILNQTVKADEIIICDDISTDSTADIISEYQKKYSNIQFFANSKNLGFIRNFEKVIHQCSGDIIIICDQDDVWENNKIEKTVRFFNENPAKDGVFHDMKLLSDAQEHPSYLSWKNISYEKIQQGISRNNLFTLLIENGSFILGCALAIRKSALKKYTLENFSFAHDYFMVLKLSAKNALGFIPETLSSYRLHDNQVYGLRYANDEKKEEKLSDDKLRFKEIVYTPQKALRLYCELYPDEDFFKTKIHTEYLSARNRYLAGMPLLKRKIYISKCIRHGNYLDLKISDLFKL